MVERRVKRLTFGWTILLVFFVSASLPLADKPFTRVSLKHSPSERHFFSEMLPKKKSYSSIQSEHYKYQEKNNDISTAEILCFLHRKTAHIQLNIEFVGANSTNSSLLVDQQKNLLTKNETVESIIVAGSVREVVIIEDNNKTLQHSEIEFDNTTKIQFVLSSAIPIGFTRTVRIDFVQETGPLDTFSSYFQYQFGVDWMRRIGSQRVRVIFDKELSLINCVPKPHVISTVGGRLVLAWYEVSRRDFSAEITFSAPLILDDIVITPPIWSFGRVVRSKSALEQVFQITNNEHFFIDGTISAPEWIELNISHWSLGVGEQLSFKATIHPTTLGKFDANITLQGNMNVYPLTIRVTGEVVRAANLQIVLPLTAAVAIVLSFAIAFVVWIQKGKITLPFFSEKKSRIHHQEHIANAPQRPSTLAIDLLKWKELLTTKEFLIFEEISKTSGLSQAEISRRTNLSKSTVSRCVNRLVLKGLVKKEPCGMSNKVFLNEEFFKENSKRGTQKE